MKLLRRQRLKDRLNLLLLLVVFVVCTVSLAALQVALHIYDNTLYQESAKVLNLSSMVIENELKRIENMSFILISNPDLQQLLDDKRTAAHQYDEYQANTKIQEILNTYASSEEYIDSINLIDSRDNQLSVGRYWKYYEQAPLGEIMSIARQNQGKNVWMIPDAQDGALRSVRAIRRIKNLDLDYLGLLIIRLNMQELVERLSQIYPRADTGLQIISGDGESIYASGAEADMYRNVLESGQGDSYGIRTLLGRRYFTASMRSTYTNWTYINIISYETIYERILIMRNVLIVIFAVLFLVTLWMGVRFAGSITRPIENLAGLIKQVEKGDFSPQVEDSLPGDSADEIKNLYRDFGIMIRRINGLIQEDYKKQLLLKDTRYRALQAQINPHFLYNTLDSINWMAKSNQQTQISTVVEALADLLRSSIGKQDIITLREELGIISNYITIQKLRYEERLEFALEAEDDCLDCLLPKLTLQPVVENAVNYGLEHMVGVCSIRVGAAGDGGVVTITVEDNGPGMDPDFLDKERAGKAKAKGSGIGLVNIDDRLKMAFGSAYGIHVTSASDRGTRVEIVIPATTREDRANTEAE